MTDSNSKLTQSRFYSPAFNAAIFDGPLRIYFAQYQEAQALKIYFRLQEKLRLVKAEKELSAPQFFVMLYPTAETYALSFHDAKDKEKPMAQDRLGDDFVFGLQGPMTEALTDSVLHAMDLVLTGVHPLLGQPDQVKSAPPVNP